MPDTVLPYVTAALEEVRRAFPEHAVLHLPDGNGGLYVVIEDVELGGGVFPSRSWVGFQIQSLYPRADVYPHFVRADLQMSSGAPLQAPLNPGQMMPGFNRPAVMVSRRRKAEVINDTAALKLQRVLAWFTQSTLAGVAA